MTIIKQGNPDKLELRKFHCSNCDCSNCGCKFIANCQEYETVTQYNCYYEITGFTIRCVCPYCLRLVDDGATLSESEIQQYKIKESNNKIMNEIININYGAVYPFMDDEKMYCEVPDVGFDDFAVSCDYGTVNPASFGLWGEKNSVWYRIKEYYFDSRREGYQRTDEEHYAKLEELVGNRKVSRVVVDPSAASFIEVIRRHKRFNAVPAENNVVNGIRLVSQALKDGRIKICSTCKDARREFALYRWDTKNGADVPIKENDHSMDDIRYFTASISTGKKGLFGICH